MEIDIDSPGGSRDPYGRSPDASRDPGGNIQTSLMEVIRGLSDGKEKHGNVTDAP